MGRITASVRLRPIRFAFLVRPDDAKRTLEIMRINTCLWGGKFNPIIPFLRRIPDWWDRHGGGIDTANQILNGYLDQYEPDFLVEAEPGLAAESGFDPKRVIKPADVLMRAGDRERAGNGLSVFDLYASLYRKEFQFERRHPHNIVNVRSKKSSIDGLCACLFGDFPTTPKLAYFSRAFKDAFDPTEVELDAAALADLVLKRRATSALDVGHSGIDVSYNDHSEEAIFVLDMTQPRDLIDFWNLRTIRSNVIGVPLQWLPELAKPCQDLIRRAYRAMPGNSNGVMLRANVMFARSIPKSDIEGLHKLHFAIDVQGANVLQNWYPAIWRPAPSFMVRSTRPILTAEEKNFDVSYADDNRNLRFDSLHPEFASEYGTDNRWANVVQLRDWSFEDQVATTFPTDFRNPKFSPFVRGSDAPIPTTEGFVTIPMFRGTQHYWTLPDGHQAIADWLKSRQIESRLSDAGRAAQQVIQTLGGFGGVRQIANERVLNLLNEISRRPIVRSMQQQEFINKVNAAVKGDIWLDRAAETLVTRNAVELGLEVRCVKCANWSWYALRSLDYKLNCTLCLREFSFPVQAPSESNSTRWAYRLIGPFALPDYANGGYAAALAIRFFASVIGHDRSSVSWSAGQELAFPTGKKIESDFILWYQKTEMFGTNHPTEIVFGEAKSFGRRTASVAATSSKQDGVFSQTDVDRMKLLAEEFPGAVIVFATLKQAKDMSSDELGRLRKLAVWGREYVRASRRSRAPVILLTGIELFCGYSLRQTWQQEGGKHEQLSSPGYVQLDRLNVIADLTQQLYLGLPSYGEWHRKRWEVRKRRRETKDTKA